MLCITQEQINSFKSFIQSHDGFIIAGHKEPDGDCVACSLGVSYILEHFKKPYILLNAGPFKRSEIKDYAPLFKNTVPFMTEDERASTGLIIVDCSEFYRLGDLDGDLTGLDTFIIDHHKTAVQTEKNSIIDASAPAAACIVQLLYENLAGPLTKKEADNFFFGMATDTGFFRFLRDDSSPVFTNTARLVEAGANPRDVYTRVSGGKPWNTRKLLGIMLDRAERHCNGKLVVTYETQEDTKKYGTDGRDSDALYQLMLSVEGVEAVLFLRQDTDHSCTAGFRSQTVCDVSAIAAKFGGGGHKNASGASIEGKLDTLLPAIIKEFSKVL